MSTPPTSNWQRWIEHPQRLRFRKIIFQLHLWCGLALGLYIFFISITGSVLVYRNELYVATTPDPEISSSSAPLLSDDELLAQVLLNYPDYEPSRFYRPGGETAAVEIWLDKDGESVRRFYDPRTLNGFGGLAVIMLVLSGLIIWWPGIKRWRRSLFYQRQLNIKWKRQIWDIHSMAGIWCAGFILVFAFSGVYLCFPNVFHDFVDRLQPPTPENAGERLYDRLLYWLAFLHFGRINGIGLVCDGPGLCDQSIKALWATAGLAPAVMFVTGATMWWNRVLSRWLKNKQD